MNNSAHFKELASKYLVGNYGERTVVLARGKGTRVWDADGREYLDFLAGISVNNLGHCHPAVVAAIQKQSAELMHCSNLYLIPQQAELAEKLCNLSFADKCFFANTGGEANEAAIKLARLYSKTKFGPGRHEIITMRNSFHGRTIATITATGQDKVQKGFEPLLEGFHYATFNDLPSVTNLMSERTCAVMIEPVQGEGGVTAVDNDFLVGLRKECSARNILLMFDEVQCGMARTGRMFAYQNYDVEPDVMTLAKALGNGMPISALLTRSDISEVFTPGTHGTTFGGNPLAMAAGLAVVETRVSENFPAKALEMGDYFRGQITKRMSTLPNFAGLRGLGLMVGIVLNHPGAPVIKECLNRGLLLNCTMGNVLRLLPPLVVTREECDKAVDILCEVLVMDEIRDSGEKQ